METFEKDTEGEAVNEEGKTTGTLLSYSLFGVFISRMI